MRVLLVHPSPLMYSEIYLRLEPLGLELVADAARRAGHTVRLLDLQVFRRRHLERELERYRPQAVGFSVNYLANVPEVLDLAFEVRRRLPESLIFAGGHSVSFIAGEFLEHGRGAVDCVVRGEGEPAMEPLLQAGRRGDLLSVPGVVTLAGSGPPPRLLERLETYTPARDLTRRRRRYFIGELDPCASIEFSRGCPWDCSFCSAWTFYGRQYRQVDPEHAADELARIREPNVFIVDDVAFIHPEHGHAIADAVERRGIRKRYYLETRADVLLRNPEVFRRWVRLGLRYMFLGVEALDEEGLRKFRKRIRPSKNFEALELARSMGLTCALNLIADPDWDEARFQVLREWALSVPEVVHVTVQTPYPGTETWHTESRKLTTLDYRLFDVQHAVLPTRVPLDRFYEELVRTQSVLNRKHLGWAALRAVSWRVLKLLARGQSNFASMIWKFGKVYNARRQYRDHFREVRYAMRPPAFHGMDKGSRRDLFVHPPAAAARSS